MKNKLIYEAYKHCSFRNIDNGLMVFINPGDRYEIISYDGAEDKVRILSEDKLVDCTMSLLAFASHFMEAKK